MSIELLQTMEWSKINWERSFESKIFLDSLLPKIGKKYSVNFSKNEDYAKEGKAFLLWVPPHSELNGWFDKRPSEILRSYVIEGFLVESDSNSTTFDFDVISLTKLCDLFNQVEKVEISPLSYVMKANASSVLQWKEARGVIRCKVGKYVYLSGSECETSLDAIVSITKNKYYLHYSATLHNSSHYETLVTNYCLSEEESDVFSTLLSQADELDDSSITELEEYQVFGAEYW